MIIELIRLKSSKTYGTMGVIKLDGQVCYWSLELGYKNNETDTSCIPVGVYKVNNHTSPKFGDCLRVENVPGRTDILFHAGNNISDTKGCILVGNGVAESANKERTVQDSKNALASLLARTRNETNITLKVTEI